MSFLNWLPAGQHLYLLFPLLQPQRIVLPVVLYIQPNKQDRCSNRQHHSLEFTSLEKKIPASFSPSFSLIQSPYIDFSLSKKKNIGANNSIDSQFKATISCQLSLGVSYVRKPRVYDSLPILPCEHTLLASQLGLLRIGALF